MFAWDNTFNGFQILVRHHHERVHVADEVYSYRGHPFWQWLRRTVGIGYGLTMERGRRIMEDGPMLVMGNRIYCSPRQAQQFKAAIARQQ